VCDDAWLIASRHDETRSAVRSPTLTRKQQDTHNSHADIIRRNDEHYGHDKKQKLLGRGNALGCPDNKLPDFSTAVDNAARPRRRLKHAGCQPGKGPEEYEWWPIRRWKRFLELNQNNND